MVGIARDEHRRKVSSATQELPVLFREPVAALDGRVALKQGYERRGHGMSDAGANAAGTVLGVLLRDGKSRLWGVSQ